MQLLRKLYEYDAAGIVDEELIDDVGIRLSLRCQSIIKVCEAERGRVTCPLCDAVITNASTLRCVCGWYLALQSYWLTYSHLELSGDPRMFKDFPSQWERCLTPRKKMLLIDHLIHRWHWEQTANAGRSPGGSLIEGTREQVVAFLDELAGVAATLHERWEAELCSAMSAAG